MVKHLPAVQETQVQSLCWEDALEEERATHSSILAMCLGVFHLGFMLLGLSVLLGLG